MNVHGCRLALPLLLCAAGYVSNAQIPFTKEGEKAATAMFDGAVAGDKLNCEATAGKLFLDFSFRFELQYLVTCPFRQFNGEADHLAAIARVRPVQGGTPVILGEVYALPAVPEKMRSQMDMRHFKGTLELSGAIGLGEGEYQVELLIADEHHRFYRKNWKASARRRGAERKVEVALQPNQVAPLTLASVDEHPSPPVKSLQLTVLLNAAPIFPFSRKLRAWDRAFLIGSLTSLMRQMPTASIRLIAFNTDQQREVFRSDSLDRKGLLKLTDALRQLELGTVSYKTIQQQSGWADLLNHMLAESSVERRTDAVLFLGPRMRQDARIPKEGLSCSADRGPELFYLEYFAFQAAQFPDSIDHLTKDCKGQVLGFHSPGELGAAIEKMRASLISQAR